ncbi:hypothetical protein IC229_06365 [Spirosoma sp. BT702]|uniref:Uncharacterized protein n=1 Tax=Spirosoma profusum TaxID=2771354 RepID=A0A926Y1G7_9BACT|nr:hypothetical protein [Spirosoma profusum]MBD2700250.1 hypothetical protein [Spirosoma profusum]
MLRSRWLILLVCLLACFSANADHFLQQIQKATPSRRIIILLNYFDTCTVVTKNQKQAFAVLKQLDDIGRTYQDEQLRRYARFIGDTYAKNSGSSNTQK